MPQANAQNAALPYAEAAQSFPKLVADNSDAKDAFVAAIYGRLVSRVRWALHAPDAAAFRQRTNDNIEAYHYYGHIYTLECSERVDSGELFDSLADHVEAIFGEGRREHLDYILNILDAAAEYSDRLYGQERTDDFKLWQLKWTEAVLRQMWLMDCLAIATREEEPPLPVVIDAVFDELLAAVSRMCEVAMAACDAIWGNPWDEGDEA